MPTVSTSYVAYQSRSGRRGHHHVGFPASFHDAPPTNASPGDVVGITAAPSWPLDGTDYTFGFWSVTGAADGSGFQTNPDLTVHVGGGDVSVRAWYLPPGGPGPGHPGFFVDAFDCSVGDFSDDDFVDDLTDPTQTAALNQNGTIDTTSSAERLQARPALLDGVPYDAWQVFGPTETIALRELDLAQGTSGFAFAFYAVPASPPPPPGLGKLPPGEAIWQWVSQGVMVDGGGLTSNGPVPPWNPEMTQLAIGVVMVSAANAIRGALRAPALELAARQIETSAKALAGTIGESALTGERAAERLVESVRR